MSSVWHLEHWRSINKKWWSTQGSRYSQLRKYWLETQRYQGIIKFFSFIDGESNLNFLDLEDGILYPKYNENLFPAGFLRANGYFELLDNVVHYTFFCILFFKFILSQKCQCDPVWLRFWILTLPHIQPFGSLCLRKEWLVMIWLKCSIYYNGLRVFFSIELPAACAIPFIRNGA